MEVGSNSNSSDSAVELGVTSYENGILTVEIPYHVRKTCGAFMGVSILAFYIK